MSTQWSTELEEGGKYINKSLRRGAKNAARWAFNNCEAAEMKLFLPERKREEARVPFVENHRHTFHRGAENQALPVKLVSACTMM